MKIEDFESVTELMKIKEKVEKALSQLEDNMGRDDNYYGHLSRHKDGSSTVVNLTGCCVLGAVMDYVQVALLNKLEEVGEGLKDLGVKV